MSGFKLIHSYSIKAILGPLWATRLNVPVGLSSLSLIRQGLLFSFLPELAILKESRYPPRSLRNANSTSRGDKLTDYFRKALAVQSHRMQNFIGRASEKRHHEGPVTSAAEAERSSAGETLISNPHINRDEDGSRNGPVDEGVKHDALHILQHFSLSTAKLR